MSDQPISTPSSGNVFADLGLSNPEQELTKANLVHAVADIIRARGLSQAEAATLLGTDQAKVSAILRGRIAGFSTDRLLRFLASLGHNVTIVVDQRESKRAAVAVTMG